MHAIEIICVLLLGGYCINYFWGRLINRQLAHAWLDAVRRPLAENFSVVGSARKVSNSSQVNFE